MIWSPKKIFSLIVIKILILTSFLSLSWNFLQYRPTILSEQLNNLSISKILQPFLYHDGLHYLSIAKNGYFTYEQAFFPLYPILIRFFSYIQIESSYIALLISIVCFLVGMVYLQKILFRLEVEKVYLNRILILYLVFPTSFFFFTAYSESLFMALSYFFIYQLVEKKYDSKTLIVGILLGLTKVIGVLWIFAKIDSISNFFKFTFKNLSSRKIKFSDSVQKYMRFEIIIRSIIITSPIIGLGVYMIYLQITSHDFLFFIHSQTAFGANRSTTIILLPQVVYRYLKIFFTSSHDFSYFVASVEMLSLIIAFIGSWLFYRNFIQKKLVKNYLIKGIFWFSILSILLPTLSGTLSSLPRYLLSSPAIIWGLATLNRKLFQILIILSILSQFLLFFYFGHGYFVS